MDKYATIELAQLFRSVKTVKIKVPDFFDSWDEAKKSEFCRDVYDDDNGEGYEVDDWWGPEEGTHRIIKIEDG